MLTQSSPIIMLELNELCPPIVDRMMAAGDLPNFAWLKSQSDVHVTFTDDPNLEPWVQWVTLHTGQPESVHGATELDEGHLIDTPRFWDKLADEGIESLIFGSMNCRTERPDKVWLLPDPWSAGVKATDPAYQGFQDFISYHVTEHTNPNAKQGMSEMASVVSFLLSHGLSLKTITDAISQIASEKTSKTDRHWRRAIILDQLMWDVFEATYKKRRPDFATFFANSTAFLQHRYWRHMSPESYTVRPSDPDMVAYGNAIEDSYRHMDRIIARTRKLVGKNGRIIFATALSQEANTRYEHIGGKFVYRPHDFGKLFEWAGAPKAKSFEPVMTHQAWATYDTPDQARAAQNALSNITSNGAPLIDSRITENRLFFYSNLISVVEDGFEVTHATEDKRITFTDLFLLIGQVNNSQHNRHGCFWLPKLGNAPAAHAGTLPLEETTDLIMAQLTGAKERQAA
jgi:phosphatidylserine decarboxylase